MTLVYSTTQEAKHQILVLLRRHTDDPVVIPQNEAEIIEVARKNRPQAVLMFLPGKAGAAVEIQNYIREFLPHSRVRILPSKPGTNQMFAGAWEKVVAKAFHVRGTPCLKAVKS